MSSQPLLIERTTGSLDRKIIDSNFYAPINFRPFLKSIGGKQITCRTNPYNGFGYYFFHMKRRQVSLFYEFVSRKKSTPPFSEQAEIKILIEGEKASDVEREIIEGEEKYQSGDLILG